MALPRWYELAKEKIGQHEVKGGENAFILECHATTTLCAKEDEVPWCSAFVNWCVKRAGVLGTNSAAAISWLKWGVALEEPREGCVVVLRQKIKGADKETGSSSGNHVAFFQKLEGGRIFLLGGNQSDSVKVSSFGLTSYEVLGYRWAKDTK